MALLTKILALAIWFCFLAASAGAEEQGQDQRIDARPSIAPDIREDESKLKVQRGNFVVVPIPMSNPTLGSGLVVAGAYFYGQTEEQEKVQPASVTGMGGFYTSSDSRAAALVQQNYWKSNKWRFTGAAGGADLRLSLLASDDGTNTESLDWRIRGGFGFLRLSRKITGHWYGGLFTRVIDANQGLQSDAESLDLDTAADITAVGIGVKLEYDDRDMPLNSYRGRHFTVNALFNDEAIGSDKTYQSYDATFNSYHQLSDSVVLAWQLSGCRKGGEAPLWDACTIGLRGFAVTDYLGRTSAWGQVEARWRMSKRWGAVGFVGAGQAGSTFSGLEDHNSIPSYGIGIRFSVLPAKRINLRVDFARSKDSDAVYVSVGEAF